MMSDCDGQHPDAKTDEFGWTVERANEARQRENKRTPELQCWHIRMSRKDSSACLESRRTAMTETKRMHFACFTTSLKR